MKKKEKRTGGTLCGDKVEILALDLFPPPPPSPSVLRDSAGVAFQRVALNPCYSRQHSSLIWSHVMPGRGGGGGGGRGSRT